VTESVQSLCYMLDDLGLIPSRSIDFSIDNHMRLSLGPTKPIQWVLGELSLGVKLTSHFHLVLRLRMCGAIPPLLISPWHGT
jgi:hypothetical protein